MAYLGEFYTIKEGKNILLFKCRYCKNSSQENLRFIRRSKMDSIFDIVCHSCRHDRYGKNLFFESIKIELR